MKGLPQTSKSIWGLKYGMHPKACKVVMVDCNSNPKCLEGGDVGMKLVEMRHPGFLKVYVRYSNAQMKDTPKMDELSKKCIVLGGILKTGGGCLV